MSRERDGNIMTATAIETTAAGQATAPAFLIHIEHHRAARGLGPAALRTCMTDPQHAARLEELSDREAAEKAEDAALDKGEAFLGGRITRCVGLGLFAASVPAGKTQKFLGYFPTVEMSQRAIHEFELATGLGPSRRSHRKKLAERDREGCDSTP